MLKKYDLSILGTVGIPASYGGFETLAEQLSMQLSKDYKIQIYCSGKKYKGNRPKELYGANLVYLELNANGWQSFFYDILSIFSAAKNSKVLLILGVSGCLILPFVKLFYPKILLVTNIDGLEWKRNKWGILQKTFLLISEWAAVRHSHKVIADNSGIKNYIYKNYLSDSFYIPYGGDQFKELYSQNDSKQNKINQSISNYYIAICRIEPENNIELILEAFSMLMDERVVIIGNWTDSLFGQKLYTKYVSKSNISLKNPIYDQMLLRELRENAKAYIHGHSAGGTNPSLVEAMCNNMAVIAYDVEYNRYTTLNKAIYWKDSISLVNCIRQMTEARVSDLRREMSIIAKDSYSWKSVAEKYKKVLFF